MDATRDRGSMKKYGYMNRIGRSFLGNLVFPTTVMLIMLMVLLVPSFSSMHNIRTVALQISYMGVATVGLAFVLIGGGNDLSIGSNITISSIIAALVMTRLVPMMSGSVVYGIFSALLTGALIGLINGFFVAKIGMNAFMLTLITQMLCDGISLMLSNATSIGGLPEGYIRIGTGKLFGIPLPVIIMLIFFIIGQFILLKTAYGRKLYAVGANRQAARLVGIPVEAILMIAFVISGVCGAFAGIILSARLGAATPSSGSYMMLDIMSAAIIGGNSLFGGKGSVIGAAAGVVLLGLIGNGLNLLGVSYHVTMVVKGVIILLAVSLDYVTRKLSTRRLVKGSI